MWDPCALIAVCGDFNEEFDEVSIEAIRGDVENTGNMDLAMRVMVPTEEETSGACAVLSPAQRQRKRCWTTFWSHAQCLPTSGDRRCITSFWHDESIVFAPKIFYPESDHAPLIASFELPETKIKWSIGSDLSKKGYKCIRSGKGEMPVELALERSSAESCYVFSRRMKYAPPSPSWTTTHTCFEKPRL